MRRSPRPVAYHTGPFCYAGARPARRFAVRVWLAYPIRIDSTDQVAIGLLFRLGLVIGACISDPSSI
uniref:3-ketoacyl-CoA synthase n=1 Tax=Oryza punctata TaxID=4537 RepID=A0A0E0L617_ORYPU